jgi:hypothetical protein
MAAARPGARGLVTATDSVPVGDGQGAELTVPCPEGTAIVAGGFELGNPRMLTVNRAAGNGWRVVVNSGPQQTS